KGPSSSLYGAGIGGVVLFSTLQPEPNTTRFSQETIGGTQSLVRTNSRVERDDGNLGLVLNYGHQQSDGYRTHSSNDRDYALFTAKYSPSARESLSVYGAFDHAFDHLPGEMSAQQFLARDKTYSDPQYIQNGAHIAIEGGRLGLANKYSFLPNLSNTTSV